MTRERVDVGNALRPPGACRRAADAFAQCDAHASGATLERTDHQFLAIMEVEADPIQVRQRVEHERGKIRGIGNAVAFAGQQAAGLVGQFGVLLALGTFKGHRLKHRRTPRGDRKCSSAGRC